MKEQVVSDGPSSLDLHISLLCPFINDPVSSSTKLHLTSILPHRPEDVSTEYVFRTLLWTFYCREIRVLGRDRTGPGRIGNRKSCRGHREHRKDGEDRGSRDPESVEDFPGHVVRSTTGDPTRVLPPPVFSGPRRNLGHTLHRTVSPLLPSLSSFVVSL